MVVSVAGRLMLRREMGKLAFGTLRDSSGAIQLFAGATWTDGLRRVRAPVPRRLDRCHRRGGPDPDR